VWWRSIGELAWAGKWSETRVTPVECPGTSTISSFTVSPNLPLPHLPARSVFDRRGGELALVGRDLLRQLGELLLKRLPLVPGPWHAHSVAARATREKTTQAS